MTKALFFDIDGTLVSFHTHRVSEATRQAIRQLRTQGIKVFIATGRHLQVINNLGDLEFDGYVTLNGSCCYIGRDRVIYRRMIPEILGTSDKVSGREGDLPLYFCPGEGYVYQL